MKLQKEKKNKQVAKKSLKSKTGNGNISKSKKESLKQAKAKTDMSKEQPEKKGKGSINKKSSQKNIEKIIKDLIIKGKKNGFVTETEIKSIFPGEPSKKVLNALYAFLADKDIKLKSEPKKRLPKKKKTKSVKKEIEFAEVTQAHDITDDVSSGEKVSNYTKKAQVSSSKVYEKHEFTEDEFEVADFKANDSGADDNVVKTVAAEENLRKKRSKPELWNRHLTIQFACICARWDP